MHQGVCNASWLNAQLSACVLQAEVVPGEVAAHKQATTHRGLSDESKVPE